MSKKSNSGWKPFRRCYWVHRMEGRPCEASTSWRWGVEVEQGGIWGKGRRAARTENQEETDKVKHGHRGCPLCNSAKSWPPSRFSQWPKVLNWHMLTYISSINYCLPRQGGDCHFPKVEKLDAGRWGSYQTMAQQPNPKLNKKEELSEEMSVWSPPVEGGVLGGQSLGVHL